MPCVGVTSEFAGIETGYFFKFSPGLLVVTKAPFSF